MPDAVTVAAFGLAGIALAPLVLLGLYLVAERLGLRRAERLMDAMAAALAWQWRVAGAVDLVGGLALAGLGVWMAACLSPVGVRIAGLVLVMPIGLWRAWRGAAILRDRQAPP